MSLYLNQGLTNSIWSLSLRFLGGLPSGWRLCFWVRLKWCGMWKQDRKHLCTNSNISSLFLQGWLFFFFFPPDIRVAKITNATFWGHWGHFLGTLYTLFHQCWQWLIKVDTLSPVLQVRRLQLGGDLCQATQPADNRGRDQSYVYLTQSCGFLILQLCLLVFDREVPL